MKKVLITGSGTGFGHEVAMRLAERGCDVIAAVEICGQVQTLKRQAAARKVSLQVEKLDVTGAGDRRKPLESDVEIHRNLEPKWTKKVRDGLGTRPPWLQKSFEMKPETPVAE